jgi:glutamate dehydrogenase (NADP+)
MSEDLSAYKTDDKEVDAFMQGLIRRNPHEPEFHQAVFEAASNLVPFIRENPHYRDAAILERMTEPDRIIVFRVVWEDDEGNVRTNRAWRVQFNNSLGPYKGGMRFHPSVTQSVLKFLGFEQVLKNSLTGLPMGGAKGGSNFNPKGKSDREVMRFCQSLMAELHRHIGEDTDVPAGDIGVGGREISYMFGYYKRLENRWAGIMTGKGLQFGGSLVRTEATGYGCVYFCQHMLENVEQSFKDKNVVVSGSGNVATYAVQKATELGAKVLTLSDSSGFIHDPDGIDPDKLDYVIDLKTVQRGRISEYADKYKKATFHKGDRPFGVPCDIALPCATQNEISLESAKVMIKNGVTAVCEGANMPTEASAMHALQAAGVIFGPGKAANAGGVAVSGLEQSQNALRLSWTRGEVDARLQGIMADIHGRCSKYGTRKDGTIDYVQGSNIAGFVKVADAMIAYGLI